MFRRYLVERDIDGLDQMTMGELAALADKSNAAIADMVGVQWQQSFVGKGRAYSLYLAESEADLREHARLTGLPIARITEISVVLDPSTPSKVPPPNDRPDAYKEPVSRDGQGR